VLEAVDGRGGDGGIDLDVTMLDGTIDTIYQLKYFPQGFSGGHRARRQQIVKSFNAAMRHSPRRWVLVVPGNLTTEERTWVRALAGKPAQVEIGATMGRAALDQELANYPRVWKYFTRDQRMEDLRIAGLERQGLSSAADIDEAAVSMGESLGGQSLHWDVEVTTGPHGTTKRITARHPDAMAKEPLGGRVILAPGLAGDAARERLEDANAFGTPVALESEAVARLDLLGSDWFAQELTDVEVHVRPRPRGQGVIDLHLTTRDGELLQMLRGPSTLHSGYRGNRIVVQLECGLDLTITIPNGENPPVDVTVSVKRLRRDDAREAVRAVRFLEHLGSGEPVTVELWGGGKRYARFGSTGADLPPALVGPFDRQMIEDLGVLSERFDVTLSVPEQLTVQQRVEIRKARLLAEGKVILDDDLGKLDATLSGIGGEPMFAFLKADASMLVLETSLQYLVDGYPLTFQARVFHPQARADDAGKLAEALSAGTAEGMPLTVRGIDGSPFRVYSMQDLPPSRQDLTPTPLEIVMPEQGSEASSRPPEV